MHTKKELDIILNQAGLTPLKKLGQNFLVNPVICQRITTEVKNSQCKSVVEIGPGLGALTDDLLKLSLPLTLIEIDSGFCKFWEEKSNSGNFKIIHSDALQLDWDSIDIESPCCLVSNLPYSIAASIVVEMSKRDSLGIDKMVLMFQKEVAERLQASVNDEDYGMLSVVAQSCWNIERLIDAGPQDFHPVPNVGSRVLTFKKIPGSICNDEFISFVKLAFSQRRKKMISNLGGMIEKSKLKTVFEKSGLSEDTRAQELSVSEFQNLFTQISTLR